jgi:hypothetical protein
MLILLIFSSVLTIFKEGWIFGGFYSPFGGGGRNSSFKMCCGSLKKSTEGFQRALIMEGQRWPSETPCSHSKSLT